MYNIAEEARANGIEVRPQIAGRPTGVLHGLQSNFHVFMGHPTYAAEVHGLPLEEKVARMTEPELKARILGEQSGMTRVVMGSSLAELLWNIFPLGEIPNYEPDRSESVAGLAAARDKPAFELMYELLIDHDGKELFYQPLGGYQTYNFDFFRASMEHPNILSPVSVLQ